MTVVGVLSVTSLFAYDSNSYMAKPGQGSLFGGRTETVEKVRSERAPQASHSPSGRFGLGVRLGAAENSPKDMQEFYDEAFDYGYSEKELTKGYGVFGLEALYEFDQADETNKIGVKLGIDIYGENELELKNSSINPNMKATENTYAFPLTVYYKKDNGIKNWSWFAGAGLTLIKSETEIEVVGLVKETDSKTKIFPHITAGAEYRFSELFALGLDLKYNIAAKVKKDGEVLSDRSGIGGAVTARFYF